MPEGPASIATETLSKVLSNVIPPEAYKYLLALVPGFVFGISIALSNPCLLRDIWRRGEAVFPINRYEAICVVVFAAYVIGNAFVLLVFFLRWLLGGVYRMGKYLYINACLSSLLELMQRLLVTPFWQRRRWLYEWRVKAAEVVSNQGKIPTSHLRCWGRIARGLLKTRYRIDPDILDQDEWNVLYWALAPLGREELQDHLYMLISEATGWSCIAAIQFAPLLITKSYLTLAGILVLTGLLHDFMVVRSIHSSAYIGTMKIRALLRELREVPFAQEPKQSAGPAL